MHAAIDIGTNSFHLVVARALDGGGFDVVTTEKEMVRLGSGGGDMKRLAPDAIERAVGSLARMIDVAASYGADVTAVATSAVREAENRDELVIRVQRELGLRIEVISGLEEARLIFQGVSHAVAMADRRALVVDIGGGSTEFVVGEQGELVEARSLRLGAIRLTERFLAVAGDGPPPAEAVAECRAFLQGALSGVARDLGGHRPELAVGSSGTIESIALMVAADRGAELRQVNGFSFTAAELGSVVDRVLSLPASGRRRIRGLDPRRVDIIVGGALLLQEIFEAFGLTAMTVSDLALREGVLYDRFPAGPEATRNMRRTTALRLARQLDPDFAHAETSSRLALQLFDRTADLHQLGAEARELLDLAALVHNVGMFISHSGHHKHSWYIIRNTEQLTGFTQHEIELIALVARYHRKSHPADRHPELAGVSEADRRLVRILAGLLRVAIGLDRRHTGRVAAVAVHLEPAAGSVDTVGGGKGGGRRAGKPERKGGGGGGGRAGAGPQRLVIEPIVTGWGDLDLEIYSANERVDLLSVALGVEVEVRPRQGDA
ncbi:MAG: Ppx/GppA phosphatase family protein [Acidimicrobiales bacterium]